MSKFDKFIAEALLFNREPKVKKVKEGMTLKDFVKMQKELDEYLEWKKSKEPKKEDKKPDTAWSRLSFAQKLTILWITVPLALMAETAVLLKFAIVISGMVK